MKRPTRILTESQQSFSFTRRAMVLGGVQAGIGALLAGRMGYIAIAQNQRYSLLAESNRVNLTLVPPRRGWIIDRVGKPIALNRTVFRVDVIPDRIVDQDHVLAELQKLLGLAPDEMQRIKTDIEDSAGFQPVQIADNLDWEKFATISIRAPDLPGVAPAQAYSRAYPEGAAVGHLVGYVGTPSAKNYQETKDPLLLTPGFKVGKEGLEKVFEPVLRGKPGAKRSEVTAGGKLVRELATRSDVSGQTLRLTIDAGLQAYASRRMGDQSGSLVAIDCQNGDILAMASMPCYDPNNFANGISHMEWDMFRDDDHLPLINKSLQGLYPPGSTTKPMTSLALLKAGIDPDAKVFCSGSYKVGGSFFHCSQRRGHGAISMHEAIVKSCDIYFYHFGRMAGIGPMSSMFRQMGLGKEFDLPVASQRYGTVPDPEWLLRKQKRQWSEFDTVNTSIGQGNVLVNPMQLAVMMGRIASGKEIIPRLTFSAKAPAPAMMPINPEHIAFVRDAMAGVINSGRGTGSVARLPVPGVLMAGKTGTAQVRRISMSERAGGVRSNASLVWKQRDHSLFVAFAPVDAPRYAMGCIIEHGGFGASAAAPLVRDSMTYLFDPAKAMGLLDAAERQWGGTIKERMDSRAAEYKRTHGTAPVETKAPVADGNNRAAAVETEAAENKPEPAQNSASSAKARKPAEPQAEPADSAPLPPTQTPDVPPPSAPTAPPKAAPLP